MGPVESKTPWNTAAGDHAWNGPAHTGQPGNEGCIMSALPHKHRRLVDNSLAYWSQCRLTRTGVMWSWQ